MDVIFLKLFDMSIAAGWLILAVIVLRLFLKKAPKWLTCMLWALVAIRLICPFSLESPLSLIPRPGSLRPVASLYTQELPTAGGTSAASAAPNPIISGAFSPANSADAGSLSPLMSAAGVLWAVGAICLSGYALISLLRIHKKVREAVPLWDNIRICDAVQSPFILGLIRPRIYLSSSTDPEQLPYVIAHEQAHIKRKDHWWKAIGYFLLAVYWFHPLLWIAYMLFCRDIELACDEKVIKDMSFAEKKAYSSALLASSAPRKMTLVCPLAFGEVGVKERIQTILSYKKPALRAIVTAVIACAVVAICFLTNPENESAGSPAQKKDGKPGAVSSYITNRTEDSTNQKTETADSALNDAISAAILAENASAHSGDCDFICCNFISLKTVSLSPASEGTAGTIICYGWALYQEYNISSAGIEDVGGSHSPVALTFELSSTPGQTSIEHLSQPDEIDYHLKEYWQPRDGNLYVPDIRSKFPADIADDGIDSQKFVVQQIQNCYKQAVESSGLDSAAVIRRLLDEICEGPKTSSNPRDYIDAHSLEYRELIYYGEYTLRYCIRQFDQRGETGLDGKIMAILCEELLQSRGKIPADAETAETGQDWYDALLAHAGNLIEAYRE